MPALNLMWTVLSKALPFPSKEWSRNTVESSFRYQDSDCHTLLDALVPYRDGLLQAYVVEELVQLVLRSGLRERALALDPVNTYEKVGLLFPEPGVFHTAVPAGLQVYFTADDAVLTAAGEGRFQILCEVDPVAQDVTHEGVVTAYTVSHGLSSHIVLRPGLSFRMGSTFPAADFTFWVRYVAPLSVSWPAVLGRVEALRPSFQDQDLKRIWEEDPLWTNRLAAAVLSAVEGCRT